MANEKVFKVMLGEDGVFHEYNDTYDVVLHFESAEERDRAFADMISRRTLLRGLKQMFVGEHGEKKVTKHTRDLMLSYIDTEPSIFSVYQDH